MELREGLEVLCEMCQSRKVCNGCPLDVDDCDDDGEMCGLLCNGFNIVKICEVVEKLQPPQEEMNLEEAQEYVKSHLDDRTKLEQLAEEAAELSQAALKLIRAKGMSDNATPIDKEKALDNVKEEIIDVLMCVKACGFEFGDIGVMEVVENSPKWLRWANRLKGESRK